MKIIFFFLLFFIFSISSGAQNAYQEGYVILNTGDTVRGYIRNVDWSKNPRNVRFKDTPEGEARVYESTEIRYFSVESLKFMSVRVMFDESSDYMRDLSESRKPEWQEHTGFIKVMLEGKASLFMYDDNKRRRFYYTMDYDSIVPLVFKKYSQGGSIVMKNNTYQQQLFNYINCNISEEQVLDIGYNLKALERYFREYNECSGGSSQTYTNVTRKHAVHITPKIGVGLVSGDLLLINRTSSSYETSLSGETQLSAALEFEYVMSFERNRFSFVVQPGYQQYEFEEFNTPDSLSISGKYLTVAVLGRFSVYKGEFQGYFSTAGMCNIYPWENIPSEMKNQSAPNMRSLILLQHQAFRSAEDTCLITS